MNTAGTNLIHEYATIFKEMDELFQTELPSNFDDELLVGKVMRRLKGKVNPNLVREAIKIVQDQARTPVHPDWKGTPHGWGDLT